MKAYLSDIIPKIKRFSQKLDDITLLTNQHWVVIDELQNSKYVYIFRHAGELLISQDGKVEKGKWEYLGNNALLIEKKEGSYLFRHGFFDENVLALKVDGKDAYAVQVNENKYGKELTSVEQVAEFLEVKYLNSNSLLAGLYPISIRTDSSLGSIEDQALGAEYGINLNDELERKRIEFNISYEDDKYIFMTYKYNRLEDAVEYAEMMESKKHSQNQ